MLAGMGDYSPPDYTGPDDAEVVSCWEDNCDLVCTERLIAVCLEDGDHGVNVSYDIPSDELYDVEIEIRELMLELQASLRERIERGIRRETRQRKRGHYDETES